MRPIRFKPQTKEEWLNSIPELIELLSSKYHFFWSKMYHHVAANSIREFLEKKKDNYTHKMCLYVVQDTYFYFVVFCKNNIDVYLLKDNYLDTQGKISYFIKKWKKYYKCLEEYE